MKKQQIQELVTKEIGELRRLLEEKRIEFLKVRQEVYAKTSQNTALKRELKKDIARILTVIEAKKAQKELEKK